MDDRKVDLVLDSGAYSAWRKQEHIDVYQYIDFCHKYKAYFSHIVNLDTIPGAWGKKPSALEVEESAQKSFHNCNTMREEGIEAMPVYHQGERRAWLDMMLDSGYKYIGISPANDRTTKQKIVWLDEIFGYLCGKKGFPEVRTHGFGVTSLPILFRYPWYSVDSVSWILFGSYGQILIPATTDGVYDYSKSPYVIHVSNSSKDAPRRPDSVSSSDSTLDIMGRREQDYVRAYLDHEGLSLEEARNSHYGRLKVNCRFYKRVGESCYPKRFVQPKAHLFSHHSDSPRGSDENLFGHMRMVFTSSGEDDGSKLMTEEGIRERLISYYHIRGGNVIDIPWYVKYGTIKARRKKLLLDDMAVTKPLRQRLYAEV